MTSRESALSKRSFGVYCRKTAWRDICDVFNGEEQPVTNSSILHWIYIQALYSKLTASTQTAFNMAPL